MTILYYFLTFIMFLVCVLLVLLVLLQLPKKEAGVGVAFGGGATDALFGAGSGNVLTKITKWVAATFFILAILMAMISAHMTKTSGAQSLMEELSKKPATATPIAPPAATPSSSQLLQTPLISNLPPAQSTSPAAAPAKPAPAPASPNK